MEQLDVIPNHHCQQCKLPLKSTQQVCENCQVNPPYFDNIYCNLSYNKPISSILHKLKYQGKKEYALALGYLLYQNLRQITLKPDIIIPVPIHKSRRNERQFNQADLLLDYYRIIDNSIMIKPNLAVRMKATEHQTLLDQQTRKTHLKDAFKLKVQVNGLHILIVDDVLTTGSTVNELARLCKENGAKQVDVCCLLRTL